MYAAGGGGELGTHSWRTDLEEGIKHTCRSAGQLRDTDGERRRLAREQQQQQQREAGTSRPTGTSQVLFLAVSVSQQSVLTHPSRVLATEEQRTTSTTMDGDSPLGPAQAASHSGREDEKREHHMASVSALEDGEGGEQQQRQRRPAKRRRVGATDDTDVGERRPGEHGRQHLRRRREGVEWPASLRKAVREFLVDLAGCCGDSGINSESGSSARDPSELVGGATAKKSQLEAVERRKISPGAAHHTARVSQALLGALDHAAPTASPSSTSTASWTRLLPQAKSLVRLARQVLDAQVAAKTYRGVGEEVRALYEDSCVLLALALVLSPSSATLSNSNSRGASEEHETEQVAAREAIKALDMALVVARTPRRYQLVQALIAHCQVSLRHCGSLDEARTETIEAEWRLDEPILARHVRSAAPAVARPVQEFNPAAAEGDQGASWRFTELLRHGPVVIRQGAADWPACRSTASANASAGVERRDEEGWGDARTLLERAGPARVVPVELGADYSREDWSQAIRPFAQVVSAMCADASTTTLGSSQTQQSKQKAMYLAQHDLFHQIPSLRHDILVPDWIYLAPSYDSLSTSAQSSSSSIPTATRAYAPPANDEGLILSAWFGPRGTVSPAHTDPFFNAYAQVQGAKWAWIAPPSIDPRHLAAFGGACAEEEGDEEQEDGRGGDGGAASSLMTNTSSLDVANVDPSTEAGRRFHEHVAPFARQVVLEPGDLLFMPPGCVSLSVCSHLPITLCAEITRPVPHSWWHSFRSLQTSLSVSIWF